MVNDRPPLPCEVMRCRQKLAEVRQVLNSLNEEARFEEWSNDISMNYRIVIEDIAALDRYLEIVSDDHQESSSTIPT